MAAFDDVRSLIPKLDTIDRRKLVMLLEKFQGSSTKSVSRSESLDADWLLQGICEELKRRGLPSSVPSRVVLRKTAPSYELASQEVRAYFEQKLGQASPTELLKLGTNLGRALAIYVESWNKMPISLRTLLTTVSYTIEALENSFPSYVAGGMLPMLAGRHIEG
jgi:hypothetical protein